jgi:hypothetical protein
MSTQEPGRTPPALTSLPRLEDLPRAGDGYEAEKVRDAFDAFRRHAAQLQAQLRVLQAASRGQQGVEPSGHAVRMDALHLIRAASEFADTMERDAQSASATQFQRTEEEIRRRQRELKERETVIDRYRQESERQRAETLNNARNEARELLANANRDATQELREAEARASRLLEKARHEATELTNATRAEVEQTLEWARAQAGVVMGRAQKGAEQLLAAAGLGEDEIGRVAEIIVRAAQETAEAGRPGGVPARPAAAMAVPQAEDAPSPPAPESAEPPPATEATAEAEEPAGDDESADDEQP